MEQKKFMDIERLKEDYKLGFRKGDLVQISEKMDGSNASVRYDRETGKLASFSRKLPLHEDNRLSGFWDYVQTLNPEDYRDTPDYVIFGEWMTQHAIIYKPEVMNRWYVYDIYDVGEGCYLSQSQVKEFAERHNLLYVHVFYEGPFQGWDHVQQFVGKSVYGDQGEGVVVKNQTRLNSQERNCPFVVKLVREDLREVKKASRRRKQEDPEKLSEKAAALEVVESIVTRARVEKELYKMRDEGLLPQEKGQWEVKTINRYLPKRIYEDCVKEEKEKVEEAGKLFGNLCAAATFKHVKDILIG